jgi:hypothetical protein
MPYEIARFFNGPPRFSGRRLGERLETLTVHHRRHTLYRMLSGHRTLTEVKGATGHAKVSITSAYLHRGGRE